MLAMVPAMLVPAIIVGSIALISYVYSLFAAWRERKVQVSLLEEVLDQVKTDRLLYVAARQLGLTGSQTRWRISLYKLDVPSDDMLNLHKAEWRLTSRIASSEVYAGHSDYFRFATDEGVFRSTIDYASNDTPKADLVGLDIDPEGEREEWLKLLKEAGLISTPPELLQMKSRMHCGSSCRVGLQDGHQETLGVMVEYGRYDVTLGPKLESEVGRPFYEAIHDLLELGKSIESRRWSA